MNPNYIVDNYKILSNSLKKQIELLPKLSSTSTKTIIKQYNEEELIICNKIRKIPLYFCYFAPIISVKFLNNQNNYILISRQDLIPFYDFFSKLPENQFNHYVINSYLHLKKAFQILNQEDILYINYGKIGFNYQNQPLIFDFERNVNDLEHLPLEQYVISFLEKSQSVSLSKENIENICLNFIKNQQEQNQHNQQNEQNNINNIKYLDCMQLLLPFINKPKNHIILEMKKDQHTWSIYCLNMLYSNLLQKAHQNNYKNCIHFEYLITR